MKDGGKKTHPDDYRTNAPAPDGAVDVMVKKNPKKGKVPMIKSLCEFDKNYPRISAAIGLISSSSIAGLAVGLAASPILDNADLGKPFECVCWTIGASFSVISIGSLAALISRAESAGRPS